MSHTVLYGSSGSLPLLERRHVIDIIGFWGISATIFGDSIYNMLYIVMNAFFF